MLGKRACISLSRVEGQGPEALDLTVERMGSPYDPLTASISVEDHVVHIDGPQPASEEKASAASKGATVKDSMPILRDVHDAESKAWKREKHPFVKALLGNSPEVSEQV